MSLLGDQVSHVLHFCNIDLSRGAATTTMRTLFLIYWCTTSLSANFTLGYAPSTSRTKNSRLFLAASSSSSSAAESNGSIQLNGSESSDVGGGTSKTLFQNFDEAGLRLKPMAKAEREKADLLSYSDAPIRKAMTIAKACSFILLFILYRSYRGLFVILPAIFRNVFEKLEASVGEDLLAENDNDVLDADINPETGKLKMRSRIVVSFLASVVTFSYMISGAMKVITKFVTTITSTSDVEKSFEAAADQVMKTEKKILANVKPEEQKQNGAHVKQPTRSRLFP